MRVRPPGPGPRYSYLPGGEGLVRVPPSLPDTYERSWVAVKQSTVPGNQKNINIILSKQILYI